MKRKYSYNKLTFINKLNDSDDSINQQAITGIAREITIMDKLELSTAMFQSQTFWNHSKGSDIHQCFFKRCMKMMPESNILQLIKLRRINKYFKGQVEDFLLKYIETAYQADANIPFPILEYSESNAYFPSCLNIYLHKALILYFHASNYLQNKACGAYIEFFEKNLKKWITACSDSSFTYEIVNTNTECSSTHSYCNISFNDKLIKLNNQKPLEAYLISEFLKGYIGSTQITLDYVNKDRFIKFFTLLDLLDPYRFHYGIDTIMISLMHTIKELMNSQVIDLGIGLLLLSSIIEKYILDYEENCDDLVPLTIKGINDVHWKTQGNALGLFHELLKNGITIENEDLATVFSFVINNAFNCKSPLQSNALVILCDLAMQGIPISQDNFDKFLPLIMTIVRDARWDVKLNAQTLIYQLLYYDLTIPEDTLKELIPCVIANLTHSEIKIWPTALALLTQLVTEDVLWTKVSADLLNSIFLIFQNCTFCTQMDIKIFPPTFLILTQHPKAEIAYLAKDIFDFFDKFEK